MTRFYIEGAEEFDRACRLLDKRDVPYDIDGGDRIMVADCYAIQVIGVFELFDIDYEEVGGVVIYHEASKEDPENLPAGWYIDDKNYTTFSIATDPEAIRELKPCLVEAGYQYEEREAFWESILGNTAPKLRLPIKVSQQI